MPGRIPGTTGRRGTPGVHRAPDRTPGNAGRRETRAVALPAGRCCRYRRAGSGRRDVPYRCPSAPAPRDGLRPHGARLRRRSPRPARRCGTHAVVRFPDPSGLGGHRPGGRHDRSRRTCRENHETSCRAGRNRHRCAAYPPCSHAVDDHRRGPRPCPRASLARNCHRRDAAVGFGRCRRGDRGKNCHRGLAVLHPSGRAIHPGCLHESQGLSRPSDRAELGGYHRAPSCRRGRAVHRGRIVAQRYRDRSGENRLGHPGDALRGRGPPGGRAGGRIRARSRHSL